MTKHIAAFVFLSALVASGARADGEKAVTDQELRTVVDGHVSDIKACMKEHGPSTGKLVVEFTIERDGHVSESKVGKPSSNHPLDACIASNFRKWSFPKPRGNQIWISNYPIVFSVPKEAPKGSLTESQINDVVRPKLPDLQACIDAGKKQNEKDKKEKTDVSGNLDLGIAVSPAGVVVEAKTLTSTTNSPTLDNCVIEHVKKWEFPKPTGGGEAAFRYPFKFAEKAPAK